MQKSKKPTYKPCPGHILKAHTPKSVIWTWRPDKHSVSNSVLFVSSYILVTEVLEGSSSEDEVEDETFGRIFPRSRTRRGEEFFPFPWHFRGRDEKFLGILAFFFFSILRTRLLILVFQGRDEARNFAPFLGHFEVETKPSRTSDLKAVQNL